MKTKYKILGQNLVEFSNKKWLQLQLQAEDGRSAMIYVAEEDFAKYRSGFFVNITIEDGSAV
jgi:hypothetical protein